MFADILVLEASDFTKEGSKHHWPLFKYNILYKALADPTKIGSNRRRKQGIEQVFYVSNENGVLVKVKSNFFLNVVKQR